MKPALRALLWAATLLAAPAAGGAEILLVTDDLGTTQSLHDFLVANGHSVTREQRTNGPGNTDAFELVLLARETNSGDYADSASQWNGLSLPLINMNPYLFRSTRWGWMNGTSLPALGEVGAYDPFPDPGHPIIFGQDPGLLSPAQAATGSSNSLPGGATELATLDGGSSHGLFLLPQGTALFNGKGTTGGVRIGFLRGDEGSWNHITPNGARFLLNSINWALEIEPTPPQVSNGGSSDLGPSSVTVSGTVTDTGGATPLVTIYYGDDDGGTTAGAWDHSLALGSQRGGFSASLTGLRPSTTYYYRSFVENAAGGSWAPTSAIFVTTDPPDPPSIINLSATSVDSTFAELNGEVTATGGEAPEVTIYWGDEDGTTDPDRWDQAIAIGRATGTFTREILALEDGTTYYFRSFARNSGGSAWATSTESFLTPAFRLPVVENAPAIGITGISAVTGGKVTDTGGDPPQVTIHFGQTDGGTDAGNWDETIPLGAQSGTFATPLTGLSPRTTYHFRCRARNAAGTSWAAESDTFTTGEISPVLINEFLAANDGGYANYPNPDQIPGRTDDWIEILNTGNTTLELAGWHLTDDSDLPERWTFPPGTRVGPGQFLVLYASGDDRPDANGNLHTNFSLDADGEYLGLLRPDLSVASEYGGGGIPYPEQRVDESFGLHPATAKPVIFAVPTPGAPNDSGGLARVGEVQFSATRGVYHHPIRITLGTNTPEAAIHYTLDGEDPIDPSGQPTPTARLYREPFTIARTTILRASATKSGLSPALIRTHSYLLLDAAGAGPDGTDPAGLNAAILDQTRPPGYPTLNDFDNRTEDDGDYAMDRNISRSVAQAANLPAGTTRAQALVQGLLDIPTLSIAMNIDDFAGPENGIYTHAGGSGPAWERACSVEFLTGDNSTGWQENCGLRVQGGASRSRSPKHALSLRFRESYGSGKLRRNIFGDGPVEEFNVLVLRAGYNNSWIHWDPGQRDRGSMIRDQWARDTMLAMGHPAAGRGRMVHLYLNGLYWGIHNLTERQDAAHYAAYHGGDEDLLDARNAGSFIDGSPTAFNAMVAVVRDGDWSRIQRVLDVDMHIDYQIMNRYGGNGDLSTGNNWRAAGGGPFPDGQPEEMSPWRLYSWDAERILEDPARSSQPVDPMGLRDTLMTHPEYRLRFADRLQKHFFHDGALTPDITKNRWMARASELDRPIIAEAARWGDHRQDVGNANELYDRNGDWLVEQARLCDGYFPVRSGRVLADYRADGFLPALPAPVFQVNGAPRRGGEVPEGGTVTIAATEGSIYYTLDGSDPRLEGGAISPAARLAEPGSNISLGASGRVRARVLSGATWSPIEEGTFFVETLAGFGDLVISEVHYNPVPPTVAELEAGLALAPPQSFNSRDFEFVEVLNVGGRVVNLAGTEIASGVSFYFPNYILGPDDRAVVVSNPEAFLIRYPGLETVIAGSFDNNLNNDGEQMFLLTANELIVSDFTYNDRSRWPRRADGLGSSLELVALDAPPNDAESWRASLRYHGSPGEAGTDTDGRVVVNEVLTHSVGASLNAIELHNTTSEAIDLSDWFLTDSNRSPLHYRSFTLPPIVLPAGGYLVLEEPSFNAPPFQPVDGYSGAVASSPTVVTSSGHGLTDGQVITIEEYGGVGRYNGTFEITVIDGDRFTIEADFLDDNAARGHWSRGRAFALSSSSGDTLHLLAGNTAGQPTHFVDVVQFAAAREGESLGRWPNGTGNPTLATMTATTLGAPNAPPRIGPVILTEVHYHPTRIPENSFEFVELCNTGTHSENLARWRLRGGVDFDFDASHEIPPGGVLVVVGFDPENDPVRTFAFRDMYGIDGTIPLVGPWDDGPLYNFSARVRLQRPDLPPPGQPGLFPQVTEDELVYLDQAPWPETADGDGDSLQRLGPDRFGPLATSWTAASPTPGALRLDYPFFQALAFGPDAPEGSGRFEDFDRDGLTNLFEYALGLDPTSPDAPLQPMATIVDGMLTLTYARNTLVTDLNYHVEASSNLIDWTPVEAPVVSSSNFIEQRRVALPRTDENELFLRLVLSP